MRLAALLVATATLSACTLAPPSRPAGAPPAAAIAPAAPQPEWRTLARANDATWLDALDVGRVAVAARLSRAARARLEGEAPALLGPALDHVQPTPGSYKCRLIRLGGDAGRAGYRAFKDFFCYVRGEEGGKLSFVKQTGSELPAGWLYPDDDTRMVFLGTRAGGVDAPIRYGNDPANDLAGILERTGPFRWRLTLPAGRGLSFYEITPVPVDAQPPG